MGRTLVIAGILAAGISAAQAQYGGQNSYSNGNVTAMPNKSGGYDLYNNEHRSWRSIARL
jgi:hypothetical protein